MKTKIFILTTVAVFAFSFYAHSQVNPHALGLRFGGGTFVGGEISYQQGVGNANRFEFDLGYGNSPDNSRLYLAGMYHWVMNLDGGLNWFIGPGAIVGSYDNSAINIGLGGQIGIEYNFNTQNVPILLSLDARPMWNLYGDRTGLGWGAALGLRYVW